MRPVLPALALAAALVLGGCQNPDGSTDWGSTVALGAGAALVTGLAVAASQDNDRHYRRQHRRDYGYGGRGYGGGRGYYGGHGHGRRW
ncbi:hypothetical protein BKE38_09040 [Pseudoroseomonas deserti]|uniref:Lipoprotein n=1 Tax=Teichococcus deserti TaxID=1817963 RepID=A0A1V2H4H5_9PROT|nr:hypothetical protein [Pseudoroseomonas deserti]ONG55527.1 hypothetical protein BKE38_09040 [Pseudoroseomonas deserti]